MTATDLKCPIDLLEHWARTHPQSVYLRQPEHRKNSQHGLWRQGSNRETGLALD